MNHLIPRPDESPDLLAALGLTVIHSLWIGALFAAALAIALRTTLRNSSPSRRYQAACLTLIGLTLMMAGVFAYLTENRDHITTGANHGALNATSASPPAAQLSHPSTSSAPAAPPVWPPLIGILWLAGALVSLTRTAAGWWRLGRICRRATRIDDPSIVRAFEKTRARMGIPERVRLAASEHISVPLMAGFLWPTVLIPVGLLHGAPLGYLQSIFAHELAHHRRWDYLAHLGIRCLVGLFFYHPAVAWIAAQIDEERERSCDDLAVSTSTNRAAYIRALAWLECQRSRLPTPAMTGASGTTFARLKRLIRPQESETTVSAASLIPTSLSFVTGSTLLSLLLMVGAPFPLGAVSDAMSEVDSLTSQSWVREIQRKTEEVRQVRQKLEGSPRQWREPGKERMFVSPLVIERNGQVFRLDEESPRLFPELPNQYLVENRLDFLDADLLSRDLDGDGFTLLEEFAVGSDPRAADSHPPLTQRLRFLSRRVKLYRVSFDALPDGRRAQLTRHASAELIRTVHHVSPGDTTPDGALRVEDISQSEVSVEHLHTGTRHRLPKGEIIEIPTWFAEFRFELGSESRQFFVRQGDTFTLDSETDRLYRLQHVTADEAIVRETRDGAVDLALPRTAAP